MRIKAVFFDAEGTLFHIHPSVGAVYARVLAGFGCRVDPEAIDSRIRNLWPTFKGYFERFERESCVESWRRIFRETVAPWFDGDRLEDAFKEAYEAFARREVFRLAPGTEEALAYLRSCGLKTAILSNWDERLYRLVEDFGLKEAFERLLVACELGVGKPRPEAFHLACESLGVRPEEALMVGNDPEDDYQGALEAGLKALLYRREKNLQQLLKEHLEEGHGALQASA